MTLSDNASTWDALGAADPLWAVLSTEDGRDGGWDVAEFFATGRKDIAWLRGVVERAGGRFGGRALDFGCGVGRLSQALAEHAEQVVGVDVAASMIEQARAMNRGAASVEFVHNLSRELPFDDADFDLVVSLIVLQHLPPALSIRYLLEFARVLRPGGILAFQLPSEPAMADALPVDACRAGIEVLAAPPALAAGEVGSVRLRLTNQSGVEWPAGRLLKLANHWLADGEIVVRDDGRRDLPHPLAPGESVVTDLRISAPDEPGRYELEFDMVQEFVAWWADNGSPVARRSIEVLPPRAPVQSTARPVDQPIDPPPGEPEPAAARPVGDSSIEIHPVRRDFVCALLGYAGCHVLHVEPDLLAGPGWASYTYVVTR